MDVIILSGLVAFLVISVIFALVRKSPRAKFRFFTVLLSAVVAFIATLFLKNNLATLIDTYLMPSLEMYAPDIAETLNEVISMSPTLTVLVENSVCAILAPLLFFVLFLVLCVVTWVVYFVITLLLAIPLHHAKRSAFKATFYGTLQAAVMVIAFLIPVACYTELVPIAIDQVAKSDILPEDQSEAILSGEDPIFSTVDQVSESTVVTTFRVSGGKLVYDVLTSIPVEDGESVPLANEIGALSVFACDVIELSKNTDIATYGPEQAQILLRLSASFGDSVLLPTVAGELIYNATDSWIHGEAFMGMEMPDAGEMLNPLLNHLITILHDDARDREHFTEDVDTAVQIIAILVENRVLAQASDTNALINTLSTGPVLHDMIMALGANPRMNVLISDITDMGIKAITTALNVPAGNEEIYDKFVTELTEFLNTLDSKPEAERVPALAEKLGVAFDDAGFVVDDTLQDCFALAMLEDMEKLGGDEVTEGFVRDFFRAYAIATEAAPDSGSTIGLTFNGFGAITHAIDFYSSAYAGMSQEEILNNTFIGRLAVLVYNVSSIPEDTDNRAEVIQTEVRNTLTSALETKGEEKAEEIMSMFTGSLASSQNLSGSSQVVGSLSAPENIITTLVTVKDILNATGSGKINSENLEQEAAAFTQIVSQAVEIMQVLEDSNGELTNISDITSAAGSILNTLGGTSSVGSDAVGLLFTSLVQSETVRSSIGVSASEAKDLASNIVNGSGDYEKAFDTVAVGFDIAASMNSNTLTSPEEIEKLIRALTPDSANIIKTYFTTDRLAEYGLPAEKLDTTIDFINILIDNIVGHDAEHREADITAVRSIINMVIVASKGDHSGENLFGEHGELEDPYEMLATLMDSELGYETILDAMTENGEIREDRVNAFGTANMLTEEDKEALAEASEEYLAQHPDRELEVNAFLALLGI
ncbi:MAG: hypothetical protein IKB34_09285 [Clostridia bacterium]|nr:hypothetical protein [Clostridia bacterium]